MTCIQRVTQETCSQLSQLFSTFSQLFLNFFSTFLNFFSTLFPHMLTFGIAPPLALKGPRLFGLEKEQPNDLYNIFYRSVRYSIFYNRKKTILPSLKYFTTLVRDELKIKYGANRHLKYAASPIEARALLWMRQEMGWAQTIPERMPTITNN